MYARIDSTDIFYIIAGVGILYLVPSLAGAPIYERALTPACHCCSI